jgi:hypothetical protein
MTHAYWWRCTLACGIRNISQILLHSEQLCEIIEVANNYEYTVSASVLLQTERPGLNKVCVSAVNNKVCVVVMLNIQVMYIIFQLYSKTLKITSVNYYSDEIKFWNKHFN